MEREDKPEEDGELADSKRGGLSLVTVLGWLLILATMGVLLLGMLSAVLKRLQTGDPFGLFILGIVAVGTVVVVGIVRQLGGGRKG